MIGSRIYKRLRSLYTATLRRDRRIVRRPRGSSFRPDLVVGDGDFAQPGLEPLETRALLSAGLIEPHALASVQADAALSSVRIARTRDAAETNGQTTGKGVFTVTRSGDDSAGELAVHYSIAGTATASDDYTALSGTVTIPSGKTTATIDVLAVDDAVVDPAETVIVNLTTDAAYNLDANPAKRTSTLTIADNDKATISITELDDDLSESDDPATIDAAFRISRGSATHGALTVGFTRGGTAKFGPKGDYTLSVNGLNLTATSVVIPDGESFVDVTVKPVDDATAEPRESVALTLKPATGYILDPDKTASVGLDDNEPTVSIQAIDNEASESGDTAVFRINRIGESSGDLTVKFTRGGTAKFGPSGDYLLSVNGINLTATSVVIPDGEHSVDVTVVPVDNATAEPAETVTLTVKSAKTFHLQPAATADTVSIFDNEPTVSIEAIDSEASESGDTALFRISRTGDTAADLTVSFLRSGTATFAPAGDYTLSVNGLNLTATSVVIPAGESSVDVTVEPVDNATAEPTETATLTLKSATTYNIDGGAKTATADILDDEPTVSIAAIEAEAHEGGEPATIRISRTGGTTGRLDVNLARTGTAISGVDFVALGTVASIPEGESFIDIDIHALSDALSDSDETMIVTVATGTAYHVDTVAKSTTLSIDDAVTAAGVDLIPLSLSHTAQTFKVNKQIKPFRVSGVLRNQGTVAAGPFSLQLVFSRDRIVDPSDIAPGDPLPIDGLAAGKSLNIAGTIDALDFIPSIGDVGSYYILIKIDFENAIGETNEINNVFASTISNIVVSL